MVKGAVHDNCGNNIFNDFHNDDRSEGDYSNNNTGR